MKRKTNSHKKTPSKNHKKTSSKLGAASKTWLIFGISVVVIVILCLVLYSPAREALFGKPIKVLEPAIKPGDLVTEVEMYIDPCLGVSCPEGETCVEGICYSDEHCLVTPCDVGWVCIKETPVGVCQYGENYCSDTIDNDDNGFTDCNDSYCYTQQRVGANYNEQGCTLAEGCLCLLSETSLSCDDGFDNDADGLVDCWDTDGCADYPVCVVDTDGDGTPDFLDNCLNIANNQADVDDDGVGDLCDTEGEEDDCQDRFDNDGDGHLDCADPDCRYCVNGDCQKLVGICQLSETFCDDAKDNDGDYLIDCADPGCNGQTCEEGAVCQDDACVVDTDGECVDGVGVGCVCTDPDVDDPLTQQTIVVSGTEEFTDYCHLTLDDRVFEYSCIHLGVWGVYETCPEGTVCQNGACVAPIDSDGDGIFDGVDNCPYDPDNDADTDGVCGDIDNCPDDSNLLQADGDVDGVGDDCDNCPDDSNLLQADGDVDGVGDDCDNCPNEANPNQEDFDEDGKGNVCDLYSPCGSHAHLTGDTCSCDFVWITNIDAESSQKFWNNTDEDWSNGCEMQREEFTCDNGEDDDDDELVDCTDDNCVGLVGGRIIADDVYCQATETTCGDTFDNDGDDLTDCADVDDCADNPVCALDLDVDGVPDAQEPEACRNTLPGIDVYTNTGCMIGDVNGDNCVNAADLGILAESLLSNYDAQCPEPDNTLTLQEGDLNADGCINAVDLGILALNLENNYDAQCGII